jgi:hypothetical protein
MITTSGGGGGGFLVPMRIRATSKIAKIAGKNVMISIAYSPERPPFFATLHHAGTNLWRINGLGIKVQHPVCCISPGLNVILNGTYDRGRYFRRFQVS